MADDAAAGGGGLVLLCHSGGWDRLYQAVSAAASAAATGRPVVLVFYFAALEKLVAGQLDAVTLEPADPARESVLRQRCEILGIRPLSTMLSEARAHGEITVLACSAATALAELDVDDVQQHVDAIVGWPTVLGLIDRAQHVLYI